MIVVCETTRGERSVGRRSHFACVTYNICIVWRVADYTDHFRMIGISCNHHIASLFSGSFGQMLDSCNERASCIDHFSGAQFQVPLNLRRHPMRPNHGYSVAISFLR